MSKSNTEIVLACNALARKFYLAMGCQVPNDYKFWEARHPQEAGCWAMAVLSYEEIEGTDVQDALTMMEDGEP